MSWESTIPYYKIINEEISAKLGALHSANIILYSLDFYELEKYQSKDDWEKVGEIIINAAKILENSNYDFYALIQFIKLIKYKIKLKYLLFILLKQQLKNY